MGDRMNRGGAANSRTSLIRISNKKSTRERNPAVACSPKKHEASTRRVNGIEPPSSARRSSSHHPPNGGVTISLPSI
jgi:hypothetical protein